MDSELISSARMAARNKASAKKILISEDGRYVDQTLVSSQELQTTLHTYNILHKFWPLAPILSSNHQQASLRMLFCGLPLRLHQHPRYCEVVRLLTVKQIGSLEKSFDRTLITYELDLFYDWFLKNLINWPTKSFYKDFQEIFCNFYRSTPQRIVHRDFHSENILQTSDHRLHIVDFQDALMGPYVYDFVCLMEDAYFDTSPWRSTSEHIFGQWANSLSDNWRADYKICAQQRLMKVIGIFSRLTLRDGKTRYSQYIIPLFCRLLTLMDPSPMRYFLENAYCRALSNRSVFRAA